MLKVSECEALTPETERSSTVTVPLVTPLAKVMDSKKFLAQLHLELGNEIWSSLGFKCHCFPCINSALKHCHGA